MRPRRCRRIERIPRHCFFKPAGKPLRDLKEVILAFDEFEAIRLVDFEEVGQIEAGKKMDVSQATLSRILKNARKKISEAIINGNAIRVSGGDYRVCR